MFPFFLSSSHETIYRLKYNPNWFKAIIDLHFCFWQYNHHHHQFRWRIASFHTYVMNNLSTGEKDWGSFFSHVIYLWLEQSFMLATLSFYSFNVTSIDIKSSRGASKTNYLNNRSVIKSGTSFILGERVHIRDRQYLLIFKLSENCPPAMFPPLLHAI